MSYYSRTVTPTQHPDASPPETCDLAIVGGGIIGLAVARELIRRRPQASVCVLEREADVGTHQTGHNSGVIHAGVYYEPGSLKARLCVEGGHELYEYCAERNIAHENCGKVIARLTPRSWIDWRSSNAGERPTAYRPAPDRRRGHRATRAARARIAGLHSPSTGIVDFPAVARSYAEDVLEAGGAVATGCEVNDVKIGQRSVLLAQRAERSRPAT